MQVREKSKQHLSSAGFKELEDSPHFPSALRNFQTEFTGFIASRFNFYGRLIRYIRLLSLPPFPMHDLCSGSGEPAVTIFKKSQCFSQLILSDKYPNTHFTNEKNITYLKKSTDVMKMKFEHGKHYTMFNAFHHFSDEDKLLLVKRISAAGSHGFIAEVLEPTMICMLKVLFATTIGNLLITPFIKPFSLQRIFFTYIIPVNIFTITYDGIISVFKSRSLKTYLKLFKAHENIIVFKIKNDLRSIVVIHIQPENKHD